ncbi:hypothetical protein PM035_01165 [Halorubrum ezzemoulense]|uniref:hypothetical protein n=1 Tax=Halorubrum ezzemoulense TaxID=337243 RepID=UPI00232A8801|nr:hypothetical protein [Halorubrum ezzemoulense]MDB2259488.1 hypothetical protein [Halorubrum ezzemoulense]MDB2266306.1 hypothetical protein [Halorubrum ezzemoulense]
MANRRKFLAGLGALASGSAAAVGTGAFTTVSADRSVTVSVADDSGALLKMDATSSNENSAYADESGNEIAIDVAGASGSTGSGVNDNAVTEIFDIFDIANQGTQNAIVYASPSSLGADAFDDSVDGVYIDPQVSDMPNGLSADSIGYRPDGTPFTSLTNIGGTILDNGSNFKEATLDEGTDLPGSVGSNPPEVYLLRPGESFEFGLYIRTDDAATGDFSYNVDIVADAEFAEEAGLDNT